MWEPDLNEKRFLIGYFYHCQINSSVSKLHRKNRVYTKNEGFPIIIQISEEFIRVDIAVEEFE